MPYRLAIAVLVCLVACDDTTSIRQPHPARIAVVLDTEAILEIGPYVTIEVEQDAWRDRRTIELDGAALAPQTHAFDCTPGEVLEIFVAAEYNSYCSAHVWWDQYEVICEAESTVVISIDTLSYDPAIRECGPIEPYPCRAVIRPEDDLLIDPDSGRRVASTAIGVSCAFDPDERPDAALYASDLRIACGDTTLALPLAGVSTPRIPAHPPLLRLGMRYAETEEGDPVFGGSRAIFTTLVALDFDAIGDVTCTASLVVALADPPRDDGTLPTDGLFGFRIEGVITQDGDPYDTQDILVDEHRVTYDELARNHLTRVVPNTPTPH